MANSPRLTRRQWLLLAGTVACYAVGYPLALIGNSSIGWVFVTAGGPLLIALGFVTIRRVHLGASTPEPGDATDGSPKL